jgi:hypothetical protein
MKRQYKMFLVSILMVLILFMVACKWDGCVLGDACDRPINATSRAIYATETYGAGQLYIQLTEMASVVVGTHAWASTKRMDNWERP